MQRRRRPPVEAADVASADVREPQPPARLRAGRSGPRAGGPRGRGRTRPPAAGRSRPGSGRAGSAGRRSASTSCSRLRAAAAVRARVDADDLDAPAAQLDRRARRPSSSVAGSRSTTRDRLRERVAASRRSRGCRARRSSAAAARAAPAAARSPRGRESRSPVISAGRAAAPRPSRPRARPRATPRDGTPRWKSERCAIRSPSSSGGRPGSGQRQRLEPHPPRLEHAPRRARPRAAAPQRAA